MYHLGNSNIPKHEGVNEWVGEERGGGPNQNTIRKCHEIKKIITSTSSKTNSDSDNIKEKGIFSLPFITI